MVINKKEPKIDLFVDIGLVLGTGKKAKISKAYLIFCPVVNCSV